MADELNKFKKLNEIEHVVEKPDTFVSSVIDSDREVKTLDENLKIHNTVIQMSDGLERLFLEIIGNASDNTINSRIDGVDPGVIKVEMDNKTISVENGGKPVPIGFNDEGEFVPKMIFGTLRTSSNYDDKKERMGCGTNGYGAKLANILSTDFSVYIVDSIRKRRISMEWKSEGLYKDKNFKNPAMNSNPVIKLWVMEGDSSLDEYNLGEIKKINDEEKFEKSMVKVKYTANFEYFGRSEYSPEEIDYMRYLVATFSMSTKVITYFNNKKLDYRSIEDFNNLINKGVKNKFVFYYFDETRSNKKNKKLNEEFEKLKPKDQTKKVVSEDLIPTYEVVVLDTPNKGEALSYVNGLVAFEGVHITTIRNMISKEFCERLNKDNFKIKPATMVRHFTLIINARLPNPKYASQSKTKLTYPTIKAKIPDALYSAMEKWDIVELLKMEVKLAENRALQETDGEKKGRIKGLNLLQDANLAGKKHSEKCTLLILEGNSAANYADGRRKSIEGGTDYYGILSLRGKLLNVRNADTKKKLENKVITAIKKAIGLVEGADYNDPSVCKEHLRYGTFIIMTDADTDGMHIAALIINFFHCMAPGLLKQGRVGYLRTPVVRVFHNNEIVERFYTESEFDEWRKNNTSNKFIPKYYKGLGSSKPKEVKDDLLQASVVFLLTDEESDKSINLAFDKNLSNERKKWINHWRGKKIKQDIIVTNYKDFVGKYYNFENDVKNEIIKKQEITTFNNVNLMTQNVACFFRAIPSKNDGLKQAQRQILYSLLYEFKWGKDKSSVKVNSLAGSIIKRINYHHGEKSLCDTIVGMAQMYIGSNNLAFFSRDGMYGSRTNLKSEDLAGCSQSRYIETRLEEWLLYAIDKESFEIIEFREVEGEKTEPVWIPSAIPFHVINGCLGIAVGWSTFIPPYNPFETIDLLLDYCNGNDSNLPNVWYRGFKGEVNLVSRVFNSECDIDKDEDELNEDEIEALATKVTSTKKVVGIQTAGIFNKEDKNSVRITELPIGMGMRKYINDMNESTDVMDISDYSSTEYPDIVIKLKDSVEPTLENLRLTKNFPLTNMHLIDDNGYPIKYNHIGEVLNDYFLNMLNHYKSLRKHRLAKCEKEIKDLEMKLRYITLVIEKKITIYEVSDDIINEELAKNNIDWDVYEKTTTRDMAKSQIPKLEDKIKVLQEKRDEIKKSTAQSIWKEKLIVLKEKIKEYYNEVENEKISTSKKTTKRGKKN